MKKLMMIAGAAALAGAMTGCCLFGGGSSSAPVEDDPVAKWQNDRFASKAIDALQKQNKLPGASDVAVNSSIGVVAAAAIINTFDLPFAANYADIVKKTDEMYFKNLKGSAIYQNVYDAAFDNKTSIDAEAARLSVDDKKVYDEYVAYLKGLKQEDQDATLKMIVDLLAQFAAGTAQIAGVAEQVKACPEFAALTGFALVKETKNLGSDISAIKDQMASAKKGLELWKMLVELEKKRKDEIEKNS